MPSLSGVPPPIAFQVSAEIYPIPQLHQGDPGHGRLHQPKFEARGGGSAHGPPSSTSSNHLCVHGSNEGTNEIHTKSDEGRPQKAPSRTLAFIAQGILSLCSNA